MDIELTTRKILDIYAVMEKVDQAEIEFDNFLVCDDLILNKKALEPHVEAFKLLNKPSADYRKYLRAHETAKNRFKLKLVDLKKEQDRIEEEFIDTKEAEMDRIDSIQEQLDKKITVKNIKLIDRRNAAGELTIKSKSGSGMHFIMAIDPFFGEKVE